MARVQQVLTRPFPPHYTQMIPSHTVDQKPSWSAVLLFLPARTAFIIFGQALFAVSYRLRQHPSPWSDAGAWWTVWGTVADLGCLTILFGLTRRENLRIRELVGPLPRGLALTGLGYFFLIAPFSVVGTLLASWILYGVWQAPMPVGEVIGRHLPFWAILFSLIVWAPIWSATEELTYNGYLAPRIAALSPRKWTPVLVVGFWWALQHSFLPLVIDRRFFCWRFLAFVPGVLALLILYRKTQKLAPLIIAHWLMDLVAAATTLLY